MSDGSGQKEYPGVNRSADKSTNNRVHTEASFVSPPLRRSVPPSTHGHPAQFRMTVRRLCIELTSLCASSDAAILSAAGSPQPARFFSQVGVESEGLVLAHSQYEPATVTNPQESASSLTSTLLSWK